MLLLMLIAAIPCHVIYIMYRFIDALRIHESYTADYDFDWFLGGFLLFLSSFLCIVLTAVLTAAISGMDKNTPESYDNFVLTIGFIIPNIILFIFHIYKASKGRWSYKIFRRSDELEVSIYFNGYITSVSNMSYTPNNERRIYDMIAKMNKHYHDYANKISAAKQKTKVVKVDLLQEAKKFETEDTINTLSQRLRK